MKRPAETGRFAEALSGRLASLLAALLTTLAALLAALTGLLPALVLLAALAGLLPALTTLSSLLLLFVLPLGHCYLQFGTQIGMLVPGRTFHAFEFFCSSDDARSKSAGLSCHLRRACACSYQRFAAVPWALP